MVWNVPCIENGFLITNISRDLEFISVKGLTEEHYNEWGDDVYTIFIIREISD